MSAQDSSVVVGIRTHIQSKILNEEREILISVPDSYTKGEMTYPVMYLLDAEEHFRHVAGIVEFLSQQKRIPSMILVGITNTKRMRDLTPKTETDSLNKFSGSGGSDRFTDFLESELFSFIEKNYRVCSYRILVGHSLGGLFAVHTWSSRAKLFNAYIAISPSLWWNGMRVIRESEVFLNNGQTIPSLYVTIGDEREDMVRSNESLHKALQNHRSHFQWKYTVMANEDHGSIAHRSVYDGLEWLYQGWLLPANYETMNLAELQKHAQEMAKKFGYAIVTEREVLSATGNRLRVKGQFEKAIAVLQFNSTQNPEWPTGYDELGLALEVAGKLDEAAIQYQYAVDKSQVIGDSNTDLFRQHWMAIQKRLKK
ncbi:hypothetical protein K1X84_11380 [bacterium]|nr:hypothetical protein [bacterium]